MLSRLNALLEYLTVLLQYINIQAKELFLMLWSYFLTDLYNDINVLLYKHKSGAAMAVPCSHNIAIGAGPIKNEKCSV